jgi:hypothetical protein
MFSPLSLVCDPAIGEHGKYSYLSIRWTNVYDVLMWEVWFISHLGNITGGNKIEKLGGKSTVVVLEASSTATNTPRTSTPVNNLQEPKLARN